MNTQGDVVIRSYNYNLISFTSLDVTGTEDITDLIKNLQAGQKLEDELSLLKKFGVKRKRKPQSGESGAARSTRRRRPEDPAPDGAPGSGGSQLPGLCHLHSCCTVLAWGPPGSF
jgi:hypothetical protein